MTDKQKARIKQEFERLSVLKDCERGVLASLGKTDDHDDILICGIDEAGRGPLAGPVAAAAVVLPAAFLFRENVFLKDGCPETLEDDAWQGQECDISGVMFAGLNDSKKVSEKNRERLFGDIMKYSEAAVCFVDAGRIDEINIRNATFEAMKAALAGLVDKLGREPDMVLIDGKDRLDIGMPQRTLVGGDGISASIAAASILAKVSRDRYMLGVHEKYPVYGFSKHKAYGTKEHREALLKYGPCPEHRISFLGKILKDSGH